MAFNAPSNYLRPYVEDVDELPSRRPSPRRIRIPSNRAVWVLGRPTYHGPEPPFPGGRLVHENENRSDGFELFQREPGERIVTETPETRVPNAAMFQFIKEDHTLAGMIHSMLLKDRRVLFAAYRVPHPLFPNFELRVQTDGSVTPKKAVCDACMNGITLWDQFSRAFTREYELHRVRNANGTNGAV